MQAAWHAFAVWGRPAHPRLRVCFAMLAGLAPLHRERLVARGGARSATRTSSSTSPPTAPERSTRCSARSASTGSSTAPTAPSIRRAELPLGEAVHTALRGRNPARCCSRHGGRRMTATALSATSTATSCASSSPRSPPSRSGGGRWCATARRDRAFEQLWRDEHVDVWVISWTNGNDTGFHDHDVSRGAVAVVEGEVIEERLVLGGAAARAPPPRGRRVRLRRVPRPPDAAGPRHAGGLDPRLLAAAVADGRLRRRRRTARCGGESISYAEELRPAA